MAFEELVQLDDRTAKAKLMTYIGTLKGPHNVCIKRLSPKHRDRQRAYWFSVIIKSYLMFMHEAGYQHWNQDMAHQALKIAVGYCEAGPPNKATGETIMIPKSITVLDVAGMSKLISDAIDLLGSEGVEVPPASMFYSEKDQVLA